MPSPRRWRKNRVSLSASLAKLPVRERIYVENRLQGLSMTASAAAAGYKHPDRRGTELEKRERIQLAIVRASQEIADEVGFSRREAHDMLLDAYRNAATAAEQIQAVKEMINLHGIAAPKQVEVKHDHTGVVSLERMETSDLMKLADMGDLTLEGEFEDMTDVKKLPKV